MDTVFDMDRMMNGTNEKMELVIVCDKSKVEIAEMLRSLISNRSDVVSEIVLQKGPMVGFSSENYILYLGDYPGMKAYMKQLNKNTEGAEYGAFIGTQGRVSLIHVDLNFNQLLKNKKKYDHYVDHTKDYMISLGLVGLVGILAPIGWGVLWAVRYRQRMREQLYICAVNEYYEKYIDKFLGINNE